MTKAKRIAIEVRAAELADVDALTRLFSHRNAYAQTLQLPLQSTEVWRKRLATNDDTQHTLVATVGGEVVGNLGLTRLTRPRRAHVGEIGMAVRDDWQGKGVGAALMKAALDLADNWLGLRRIELHVHADNERAIALYRRFGSRWKEPTAPIPCGTVPMSIPCRWLASPTDRASRQSAHRKCDPWRNAG